MRAIGILISVCGVLLAQDFPRRKTDPVRVDPAHYSVESEADGILAVRLKLGPDENTPPAYIQDALLVCLSECHVRLTLPKRPILKAGAKEVEYSGPQIVDLHMEAGTTRLMGAGVRAIANLSTKPVEMLFIERKDLGSELK